MAARQVWTVCEDIFTGERVTLRRGCGSWRLRELYRVNVVLTPELLRAGFDRWWR